MKLKYLDNQQGMILTIAILLGLAFSIISVAVVQFSVAHYTTARRAIIQTDALDVAEAGADNFMYHINADSTYTGTNTSCPITSTGSNPVTLYSDSVKGKGTYETCVQAGSITNEKIVYSTGKVYQPTTAAKPTSTRTVRLIIEGSTPSTYAVQTGPGGIILGNNVLIGNGDVYTNGFITMSNNSQIGTVATPSNVFSANYQCPAANPPGATYPALCGSGEPITMSNNTHIYGNVKANGEVSGGSNANKMSGPGLTATSGVGLTTLPDPNRAGIKATITTTWTPAQANTCNNPFLTWTNVHITGNVSLPNNCSITVGGNVWIDGNFSTGNNNTITVANALATQPQIMVDGSSGMSFGNNTTLASNPTGVGFMIVAYWNASGNLDATTLTGNNLYNSMYSSNNRSNPIYLITTGNNSSAAAGTTLYARWSGVQLNNNGNIGGLMGQIIDLENNGTVSFGGSSSGSANTWDVRYYEQI